MEDTATLPRSASESQLLPLPLGVLPATSPRVSIPVRVASAEEGAPFLKVMRPFWGSLHLMPDVERERPHTLSRLRTV